MSPDLRDLLHAAAPDPEELDLGALRARVRSRARRRRVVQGAGLAAVIALAAGLTSTLLADDGERQLDVVDVPTSEVTTSTTAAPATTPAPTTTEGIATGASFTLDPRVTLPDGFSPRALAVTGETVWVGGTDQDDGWVILQVAATGGEVLATIPLPGAVREIVVDQQALWVWGGGDGGEPVGGVGLIDVHDTELLATFGWEQDAPQDEWVSTYDLALLGGDAWVSDAVGSRVFRLRPVAGELEATPVATNEGPHDILATDDGQIWVREGTGATGTVARIDPEALAVAERNEWVGGLSAWDPATRTVWGAGSPGGVGGLNERPGFATGDPVNTLPHGAGTLHIDGQQLWVHEGGRIVRYTRTEPGGPPRDAIEVVAQNFVDLAVVDSNGWYLTDDQVGLLTEGA